MNEFICRYCDYLHVINCFMGTMRNNYNPRKACYCMHPKAPEMCINMFPKSSKIPTFIDYTEMGGDIPKLKTSPRWCPLKHEEIEN